MVLAAEEGVLLVQDHFVAKEATTFTSLNVGPVWHFSPSNTPVVRQATGSESAWVMSQGARVDLFVGIDIKSASRPVTVGVQRVDVWGKNGQQSAFGRVTLEQSSSEGGRVWALSLLVPVKHSDVVNGHERSFVTSTTRSSDGEGVLMSVSWPLSMCQGSPYCGTRLEIRLGTQDGRQWNVTRTTSL